MRVYDIIVRPLETEKAYLLREQDKYVFVVHMKANKLEVKRAVEEIYGVNVNRVRTMIMPGKVSRMRGRRRSTRRAPWKKAVVTLAPGERIEALEA
ncbi:MAG: 50S ribosomal protein L23 [Anaerolineae bacterium]|nr:50S ribosomal protein L23 [Anaerolineae bacterium]